MTRKHMAGLILLAAAFVNAGILALMLNNRLPQAHAGLVDSSSGLTMLTARTAESEDSVFVLDAASGTLLIYKTTLRGDRGDLNLVDSIRLGSRSSSSSSSRGAAPRVGR